MKKIELIFLIKKQFTSNKFATIVNGKIASGFDWVLYRYLCEVFSVIRDSSLLYMFACNFCSAAKSASTKNLYLKNALFENSFCSVVVWFILWHLLFHIQPDSSKFRQICFWGEKFSFEEFDVIVNDKFRILFWSAFWLLNSVLG